MEFYIARQPIFSRGMEVFGYKLSLCPKLRDYYYAQYKEPESAEALYRLLCFSGYDETEQPAAFMVYSEEMLERLVPLLPRDHTVIEYVGGENSEQTDIKNLAKIVNQGYRVAFDAPEKASRRLIEKAHIMRLDFSAFSPESLADRAGSMKGRTALLGYNIETWGDFKKAFLQGFDYFQGNFFLKPFPGNKSSIKSLNANILRVITELRREEPSFKEITNIIEHDLNLSYRLLKLVNSAYFAPRFRVKTISQAVTMLGLKELNKFASAALMMDTQSPGNTELLRRSLLRGKLMELLADSRNITQKGSEAFFTGIFSLIDVILNRKMEEILAELPLTDDVKAALTGADNGMRALLELVAAYETGDWEKFEAYYVPDMVEQEELMNAYISALEWAEALNI